VQQRASGYAFAAVLVVATVGALAYVFLGSGGGPDPPSAEQLRELRSAASAAGCRVESFPTEGRDHVSGRVTYKTNPPTSGPHAAVAAPDRAYDTAPPPENYVHSLEHGRIELQYRPSVSPALVAGVRSVYDESPEHVLLFPNNTGMPFEVAATAWKHLLGCPSFNARVPEALRRFRDAYRDRGPEEVP
jgi:hypothetical protein